MTFVINEEKFTSVQFAKPIQKPEIESLSGHFRDAYDVDYQMELMANDWATYGDILDHDLSISGSHLGLQKKRWIIRCPCRNE